MNVKITAMIKQNDSIIEEHNCIGKLINKTLLYEYNNTKYEIDTSSLILIRETPEYKHTINFSINDNSVYLLKEINMTTYIPIIIIKKNITNNTFNVQYKIKDDELNFEYNIEWRKDYEY